MKFARMRYTFEFDIPICDIPDYPDKDWQFDIDENHCLGTGRPGYMFEEMIDKYDEAGTCWACGLVEQEWLGIHEGGCPWWAEEVTKREQAEYGWDYGWPAPDKPEQDK